MGDQFPGWHAERTHHRGTARERGGLELSAQPVGHFKMVVVCTGVSQNSPSFGFRKYCNLPRMMETSMSFCC